MWQVPPMDVTPWAPALRRLERVLSLSSLLPVVVACRFDSGRRFRPPREQGDKEGTKQDENAAKDEEPARILPLGFAAVLLMLASELTACYEVFVPVVAKAGKASKAAAGASKGPLGALLKGVKTAHKAKLPKDIGMVERVATLVATALTSAEAFHAMVGLVMVAALVATLLTFIFNDAGSIFKLFTQRPRRVKQIVAVVAPLVIFAWLRADLLTKAVRTLASDQLLPSLRLPLRVAGLLTAAGPMDESGRTDNASGARSGGTPGAFAMLQMASLATMLSAEVALGHVAKAIAEVTSAKSWAAKATALAFDSSLAAIVAPIILGIVGLILIQLHDKTGRLMIAAILSVVTSPIFLVQAWPTAAASLGIPADKGPEAFIQSLSVCFALTAVAFVLAGGTVVLIAVMVIVQLLMWLHGPEALGMGGLI